ncbi:MAG: DUF5667 domain-containing protein [Patescibacteria group bacterium]
MLLNFFTQNQEDIHLGKSVVALGNEIKSPSFHDRLKSKIMQSVKSSSAGLVQDNDELPSIYRQLLSSLQSVASSILPPVAVRSSVFRRVMRFITRPRLLPFNFSYRFTRAFSATAVLAVFVFVAVFSMFANTQTVRAAPQTYLQDPAGKVEVVRRGVRLPVRDHMVLKTKDIIRTGADSSTSIYFLDDSVARLDENTELRINKLFVNPVAVTETFVEVNVEKGRVWSRVVNLIDDNAAFQVKTGSVTATARKKAAFDVDVGEKGKTKVSTFQHSVNVTIEDNARSQTSKVSKGFEAEFQGVKLLSVKPQGDVVPEEKKDTWVETNLAQDQEYVASLIEERGKERQSQLVGGVIPVTEISVTAQQFFGLTPSSRIDVAMKAALVKLTKAEQLLNDGEKDKADKALEEYKELVVSASDALKEAEKSDPGEYAQLQRKIDEHISFYKKQFAVLLPDQNLHQLKEVVGDAEFTMAATDMEKTEIKLEQANERLFEAKELSEKGEHELASEQLEEYSKAVGEVVETIKDLPRQEQEQVVAEALDQPQSARSGPLLLKTVLDQMGRDTSLEVFKTNQEKQAEEDSDEKVEADPVTIIDIDASSINKVE